jgi:hypothetical protein
LPKNRPSGPARWNFAPAKLFWLRFPIRWRRRMNGIIYLIGLIVVIMAILSFLGLR